MASHNIKDHQKIVPQCRGCQRIFERYDGEIICNRNAFPDTKWWFGLPCPDTTALERKPDEDPIKEP